MEEMVLRNGNDMEKRKRCFGRCVSWLLMAVLILIIVPIGAVMFVISGLWSALDRALQGFNR